MGRTLVAVVIFKTSGIVVLEKPFPSIFMHDSLLYVNRSAVML
jgi:hypothetical protein